MSNASPEALPTQPTIQADVLGLFRGAISLVLEARLEQQVREMVDARCYERLGRRKDHLNRTHMRRLLTSMGMTELQVPRTRTQGSAVEAVGRCERPSSEIDEMVTAADVQGVSTRDVRKVTEALMGKGVGRSTVRRVTSASPRLSRIYGRPRSRTGSRICSSTLPSSRRAGPARSRTFPSWSPAARTGRGTRRLLAATPGSQESEAGWVELREGILARGLSGVQLVISDAHAGLAKAVRR